MSTKKAASKKRPATGQRAQSPQKPPSKRPPSQPRPGRADRSEEVTESPRTFPIVGIGASAGGLEALEQFLKNVPARCGMAFVVIQHLDPLHKGNLVELLQRSTSMPVAQVENGLKVEPDRVYVIPPGKDMSISRGALHLTAQEAPRRLNLPIDFFFRSLADDQQEHGIGVILSGMGSDGTLGLRAIKESAGAGFVQAIASAKFDGMPRSAIEAGLADVVAPAEELPGRILAYRRHVPYIAHPPEAIVEEKTQSALDKIYILLRSHTGNDFSLYKKSTIIRRVERRMGLHQIDGLPNYVRYLRDNPREIELLFRELLIGVTSFFRDPAVWEYMKTDVVPGLLAPRASGAVLRAWVPGCSTGEEPYSLAIIFKEALEELKTPKNVTLQVFATDLDRDAVEKAREGIYPTNIAADVSPERLHRFFVQDERGYRVSKEIREMVVFAPQNIIMDPPFTKLDILSCRNLLIYLSPQVQKKLIPLFHYSLNPNGILFLGTAETVGSFTGLFGPVENRMRIYRRIEGTAGAVQVDFPIASFVNPPPGASAHDEERLLGPAAPNLQALANQMLVQRFAPAALLTSDQGDIHYISGRTGRYLEPAIGRATMNVFAMAREGLRLELTRAFAAALRASGPVVVKGVRVTTDAGSEPMNLTVQKINEPKELRGMVMIVLEDVRSGEGAREVVKPVRESTRGARSLELEHELQRTHDEMQTLREEMQTSQEELKSTNEELQSTNEELQSTNEELTTSKEEMQSMNEELQTVNHELQAKVDELSRSNNDMKNLLNSTDIATLFLDGELCVRRFTTPISSIIKLIASDAGRPITDIARDIDYPELAVDARDVLRTLIPKEKIVPASNDRWFTVRILPYRTVDNVIDGLVITFTDATITKSMELAATQQASELRQMLESLPDLVWKCRADGACDYVTGRWSEYTGVASSELLGHGWLQAVHADDRKRMTDAWRIAVQTGAALSTEFRLRGKTGVYRWFRARAVPLHDVDGKVVRWFGTNADVDDLKRAADERQRASDHPGGSSSSTRDRRGVE